MTVRISEYEQFLHFAEKMSNEVFIILGEPGGAEFDPKKSTRHNLKGFIAVDEIRERYALHYEALEELDEIKNVKVIDPIDYLCDEVCKVMDENFNYYYKDDNHYRPWYAKESLGYLDQILN